MRRWVVVGGALVAIGFPRAEAVSAQDELPGVSLGLVYANSYLPALVVKPFTGSFGGDGIAPQVEAIIGRDLRGSDRFEVMDSLPAGLLGVGVDYTLWDRLGAVWLVSGEVEGAGEGYVLILELHDVVYGEVTERGRFRLPSVTDEDFRMAVHRTSDEIVRWATGDPGMAASRIVFTMKDADFNEDIYVIDPDGENLQRVTRYNSMTLSPTWSPDGERIALASWKTGVPRIYEVDRFGGNERMLPAVRGAGDYITPAYHPDGSTLAFSVLGSDARSGIFTYDLDRDCCLSYLSGGPWYDIGPTYSSDGRWLAFNTMRFGDDVPQVMKMPAEGGPAETLSPYEYGDGGFYAAPDWSPYGDLVAFHGRIDRRGRYHILVANLEDHGKVLRQLTSEGNNEDPSWAPDGRHLVFVGERSWGFGLMIVDVTTGRIRSLLGGRKVGLPDWSPALTQR
ncbi:MAG: PD40 domain-containing protein [Gemmatimonadetes bacterium]|nr:PD40 domain-containing protein [Gemmatimonadota bacterium]